MEEPSQQRRSDRAGARLPLLVTALIAAQVVSWLTTGEDPLRSAAWTAVAQRHLETSGHHPGGDFGLSASYPTCLAAEPGLWEGTPLRLRRRIREVATIRGLEVRATAARPPSRSGPRLPDCVYYQATVNLDTPLVGMVTIAYHGADFNGDEALMLFAFGKWLYLTSWNVWL